MNWERVIVCIFLLWGITCSNFSEGFARIGRFPLRLRKLLSHTDGLSNIPFIIDIETEKMVMGPGVRSLRSISPKKMNELIESSDDSMAATQELEVEQLDMATVTSKWAAYCQSTNKPVDTSSYDIRDVITACMKAGVLSQIIDEKEATDAVDTTFVTENEIQRLFFERMKSNKPMNRQDVLDTLLYIADEDDMKFEEESIDSTEYEKGFERFSRLEDIRTQQVPIAQFFGNFNVTQDSSTVAVYKGMIPATRTEFITLPELARAWEIRCSAGWGLPKDKSFDPKTALLLLTENDDEEDTELVDGPVEFVEAKDAPHVNPFMESLSSVTNDKLREVLRAKISEIDGQEYEFNYPPSSPMSPEVETQFVGVENFMHSKNPIQHRIPANWDDPEQPNWKDSDMYELVSTMALPGEPETNFDTYEPLWKQIGLNIEELSPHRGRYLDYIVEQIDDIDQLVLPPVVEWSIKMHSKDGQAGLPKFEDLQHSKLARGMLGGQTDKNLFEDIYSDIFSFAEATNDSNVLSMAKQVEEASEMDAILSMLKPNQEIAKELEMDELVSPTEDAALSYIVEVDDTATYFDDLEMAVMDAEEGVNVDFTHPDSKWMRYKALVEQRLDKYERIANVTEDDIIEDLEEETDSDDELKDFSFNKTGTNVVDEVGIYEKNNKVAIGDEDQIHRHIGNLVTDALMEMEQWTGSEGDNTNVFHPRVLKPVFNFTQRLDAFRLKQAQQKAIAERADILSSYSDTDENRPRLPKIPTELDLYNNDVEYMESMKYVREVVSDPGYEDFIEEVDEEIKLSWKEYWNKEKPMFLESVVRSLRGEGRALEGSHAWDDIENSDFDIQSDSSLSKNVFESHLYDKNEEGQDDTDSFEEGGQQLARMVAVDRSFGIHEPNDTYPSKYYPTNMFKKLKLVEETVDEIVPSIDSLYAEYEALKTNVQQIAEDLADTQLPFADLESQELGYNFEGNRVPDVEKVMTDELEYVPWMDVYHWERYKERWSQGYYDEGAFRTPPAWLLRPEYKDMVGFDVWSKYDRRLFYDWQDDMLDEDVYAAASVQFIRAWTDLYLTNHAELIEDLNKYHGLERYLSEKMRNPAAQFPIKQGIPKKYTPDIDRGIEYTDELCEMRHGRQLIRKMTPMEKLFENDTFTFSTDTVSENIIGTIHENYHWKPLQNITREVEPEKATILQPLIDYINHMGKLVSTNDDIIIFDYFGPMKILLGVQGSMEYMAKQLYPGTKQLRLETERNCDRNRLMPR